MANIELLKISIRIPCILYFLYQTAPNVLEGVPKFPLSATAFACHWATNFAATSYKQVKKLLDSITKKLY